MTINELLEYNFDNLNFRIFSGDENTDIENRSLLYDEFGDCEVESWRAVTARDDETKEPYSRIDIRIVA